MKGRVSRSVSRRLAAVTAAVALTVTACTTTPEEEPEAAPGEERPSGPRITITPEAGAASVAPDTPVRVSVEEGAVTDVSVEQVPAEAASAPEETGGAGEEWEFTGTLSEDGTRWVSDWNLRPGASVTVRATAEDDGGEESEAVAEFTTEAAVAGRRLELASNFPNSGDTVGVGMPVIVNFDMPVRNKVQVENSMEVTSEHVVEGAWNWTSDKTAVFRPQEYWEPHQRVTVDMRLAGVDASEGVYGVENHRLTFEVGRELVATMHVPDHQMRVAVDGEAARTIPVSNGEASERFNTTTSGTHLTMTKHESLVMDAATLGIPEDSPDYYKLDVDWAVRTSNSGEFVHAAPWNDRIGEANTSNGCTNLRVEDARWFYDTVLMGDVLETTGTDRELEWNNGWGFWQRSWEEWLSHSATGEPDVTDGEGTPASVHGEGL
ncbi:L,D-transpeptidase [Nocardiopsis halotolerans]|uniref:L,D-transpeptidase n=1 Tax=Nocardiopsis halotolerans TaxID=124252 RepID=UPI0003475059|nr:Ig-like domain-containing protein [Nocardiopsis halotolerans]